MNAIKLAVFDCDGTIVDSQHSIIHSMHAAFTRFDLPVPEREAVRRVVGLPLLHAIEILAPAELPSRHEEMKEAYSLDWQDLRASGGLSEPLYPGFIEVLDVLQADGWVLGVATGKSHRGLVGTLEKYSILDRFATLQTADRALGKPNPDMLLKAMDETGAAPADTIMIGDTTFDIEMSVNANVRAIGVSWGYHDVHELMSCGAETVIYEFGELPSVLSK